MRNVRWQIVLLIIGLALIVGVIINQLRVGPDEIDLPPGAEAVYIEASFGEPRYVNPLLATSQPDRDLSALVFSGLTRLNEFGEPVGDLADSWDVSNDGLTYSFNLRRNVTWHDGQPFTSADVDFTMALLRNPDFAGPPELGTFWQTVETYTDGEYAVRFVLTQPLSAFPEFLKIGILPAHLLEGTAASGLADVPFNLAPVGTGRFALEGLTQSGQVVVARLTPYTGFYDQSRLPALARMELHFYANENAAFSALSTNRASGMAGLSAVQVNDILSEGGTNIYTTLSPSYSAILFNQQEPERLPFFQDRDVRRALIMALDRPLIVQSTLAGQAVVADSPVLPGNWGYNPLARMPAYNPEQAGLLLDEAGWLVPEAGGTRLEAETQAQFTFTLLVADDPVFEQIGRMVVDQWSAAGIGVRLEVVDAASLRDDRLLARNFDAALVEFGMGGLADPDPYPFWHQSQIEGGQNLSGFDSRDVSESIEIARRDSNGVRRAELYREFQQLFVQESAAVLLYYPVYSYAIDCRVAGIQLSTLAEPSDRFRSIGNWQVLSTAQQSANCAQP